MPDLFSLLSSLAQDVSVPIGGSGGVVEKRMDTFVLGKKKKLFI